MVAADVCRWCGLEVLLAQPALFLSSAGVLLFYCSHFLFSSHLLNFHFPPSSIFFLEMSIDGHSTLRRATFFPPVTAHLYRFNNDAIVPRTSARRRLSSPRRTHTLRTKRECRRAACHPTVTSLFTYVVFRWLCVELQKVGLFAGEKLRATPAHSSAVVCFLSVSVRAR